ncbi:MAG TPA: hypothetical protein VGN81_28340 [Pseudonocardiaceae bacterium]|jgi:hypothetical protein
MSNGRELLELFAAWRGDPAFDDAFEEHVRQAREAASADAGPWLD